MRHYTIGNIGPLYVRMKLWLSYWERVSVKDSRESSSDQK